MSGSTITQKVLHALLELDFNQCLTSPCVIYCLPEANDRHLSGQINIQALHEDQTYDVQQPPDSACLVETPDRAAHSLRLLPNRIWRTGKCLHYNMTQADARNV